MRIRIVHAALVLAGLAVTASLSTGCELLVQLDRSAVEIDDAGCPICADGGDDGDDTSDGDDGGTTVDDAASTPDADMGDG